MPIARVRQLSTLVSLAALASGVTACGAKTDEARHTQSRIDGGVDQPPIGEASGTVWMTSVTDSQDAAVVPAATSDGTTALANSVAPPVGTVPVESTESDAGQHSGEDGGAPPLVVPIPTSVLPTGCANQCGNQVIDSCEVCTPARTVGCEPVSAAAGTETVWKIVAPPPPCTSLPVCTTYSEQCDGPLDPTHTCEGIGFSGGQLNCSSSCTVDDTQCESCSDDPRILKCRDDLAAGEMPVQVALAANAERVAVAWIQNGAVRMGVYDESLTQVASAGCAEWSCSAAAYLVALSALPAGWLLAAADTRYVLNETGALVSSHASPGTTALYMAQLPGSDSTLLVRNSGAYGAVEAALIDADGSETWVTEIADDAVESHYGSAAALSDGFLIGLRTSGGAQVLHLTLDGVLTGATNPGGSATEYPQVAATDDVARVVWADFLGSPTVFWAKLATTGERLGEPVQLGGSPQYFNRSPLLVVGEDSLILFGGYTGATGVGQASSWRRVDSIGETVYGDYPLQQDPNQISWPQVVEFQGDAVSAWVGGGRGRIGLAKWRL